MSNGFEERLKRLAKDHARKSEVVDRAQAEKAETQKAFLLSFSDAGHNKIMPMLERAKGYIEEAGELTVSADFDSDEKITFSVGGGNDAKHALLVFLADPVKLRVRLHMALGNLGNSNDTSRLADTQDGRTPAIATYTLPELEASLETQVLDFAEKALR